MTTAMGLALAIDYSLFVVSRYREEIRNGAAPDDAVRRTMQTAGRTVLFSALTVGLSLAALLVFPVYFLRSFAYAGIAVVALATLAALRPAAGAADAARRAGRRARPARVRAPRCSAARRRSSSRSSRRSGTASPTAVMRRALPVGLLVTAVLVALGLPFLHATFGYPDDRVLPHSASAHQVGDDLRTRFAANAASTISIVATDISAAPVRRSAATPPRCRRFPGVTSVSSAAGTFADGSSVAAPDRRRCGRATRPTSTCTPTPTPQSDAGKGAARSGRGGPGAVAGAVHRPDRGEPRQPGRAGQCAAVRARS